MLSPIPYRSSLAEVRTWLVGRDWHAWFRELAAAVDLSGQRAGSSTLAGQGAALPATTLVTVPADGLYRLSHYLRITQAATVSSSATVTFRWTDGGVACALTVAAVNGNTTDSVGSIVRIVRADKGTAITIEVAYASSGATPMQFRLDARVEAIP